MKPIKTLLFALCLGGFIITGCKKEAKDPEPDPAPAPTPDPYTYSDNLQSSKDISAVTYAILDVDMIGGFLGERVLFTHFYAAKPSSAQMSTVVCTVDTSANILAMSFNDTQCIDGKKRKGTVLFKYAYDFNTNRDAKPEGKYYRSYGFSTSVDFDQYIVGDWLIQLFDPTKPAHLINRVSSSLYDPATTNLTWEISGKFKMINIHTTDKDIVWEGKIIKTLTNTNDPAVFKSHKQQAINWNLARVSYTGLVTGTIDNVNFTYTIDNAEPLIRNFNCNVVPSGGTEVTQFHPLVFGKASLAWSNFHPRTLNYGPVQVCDNSGTIDFKDETHTVDFD